ncbi:Cenp-O kinetochore centromere component-domain-containing protein [Coniella lustricola]|uniref:Cenp-O kinetochore centromere component-domain-containing protein n=1 Tax=Coniella lustricola TaxID=2025994 RepID=A0A2T3A8I7_9PEZI|nr:Cenp-O kinetochore centromere component-domain-containing protein [Coniella lustricola]
MASLPESLDDEIASLQARVDKLKTQIKLHANVLLNTEPTQQLVASDPSLQDLQGRLDKQKAYKQQCLYRTCAGITTFRANDPDPNAVNDGIVLGVRIEIMTRAKFLRPYYVLLNRPYKGTKETSGCLRIHRHTVPPCIPINGLAARYLPAPSSTRNQEGDNEVASVRQQNLPRFVRALRREIVRYHNRVAVIADLRKAVGLDGKRRDARQLAERSPILAISAADTQARQVRIDWKDGRAGRLVIGNGGEVMSLVVFGETGRDREITRDLLSDGSRLEDVARRLAII